MVKILFVCHGNICRSPMGEYVLKDMAEKAGRAGEIQKDIAFFAERREMMSSIVDMIASGEIPLRVTHNDTKMNNVITQVNKLFFISFLPSNKIVRHIQIIYNLS